jgi:hypothetical protein
VLRPVETIGSRSLPRGKYRIPTIRRAGNADDIGLSRSLARADEVIE